MHSHSRSSSYHTASECAHSPWWETADHTSLDADSSDQEAPSMELLSGVIVSSASASFDDSEQTTFHSPISSDHEQEELIIPLQTTDTPPLKQRISPNNSNNSQSKCSYESPEDDLKSGSSLDNLDKVSACSTEKASSSSQTPDALEVSSSNRDFTALAFKELSGLSYYYQNIITKQSLKTCL